MIAAQYHVPAQRPSLEYLWSLSEMQCAGCCCKLLSWYVDVAPIWGSARSREIGPRQYQGKSDYNVLFQRSAARRDHAERVLRESQDIQDSKGAEGEDLGREAWACSRVNMQLVLMHAA